MVLAVRIASDETLVCTSDVLGLYPLFMYAQPGLTICTSATPLLEGVPGFRVDMDEQAIAHSLSSGPTMSLTAAVPRRQAGEAHCISLLARKSIRRLRTRRIL
jgi:hypothetical protein